MILGLLAGNVGGSFLIVRFGEDGIGKGFEKIASSRSKSGVFMSWKSKDISMDRESSFLTPVDNYFSHFFTGLIFHLPFHSLNVMFLYTQLLLPLLPSSKPIHIPFRAPRITLINIIYQNRIDSPSINRTTSTDMITNTSLPSPRVRPINH